RLIRSKGVGIYFITQNPADIPDDVLGQLGNRVQHALRAFTAKDQQDLHRAAENYRPNPRFDTESAIKDVGIGEAVTSFLEAKGAPGMVERTLIRPPASQVGPITPDERAGVMAAGGLAGKYDMTVDRDSAFEKLQSRAGAAAKEAAEAEERAAGAKADAQAQRSGRRYDDNSPWGRTASAPGRSSRSDTLVETLGKSIVRQIGSSAGRAIVRGVLGSLFKSR
ncbi:MAG: DUF853 family protein, partial [Rhodobacteraceae bacterium]|nr:DUF853 family protein [Paracoccaceae bacterium]